MTKQHPVNILCDNPRCLQYVVDLFPLLPVRLVFTHACTKDSIEVSKDRPPPPPAVPFLTPLALACLSHAQVAVCWFVTNRAEGSIFSLINTPIAKQIILVLSECFRANSMCGVVVLAQSILKVQGNTAHPASEHLNPSYRMQA